MPRVPSVQPAPCVRPVPNDRERHPLKTEWLDLLQWPAMLVSITAAWLVASSEKRRRSAGFWVFLVSNVLWIAWGAVSAAWALIVLQVALAAMNIRGVARNDTSGGDSR